MNCGKVELPSAGGAASNLEDARDVGVGELLNLSALLCRLGAVRGNESLVLYTNGGSAESACDQESRTNRVDLLLLGRELLSEVSSHKTDAGRAVCAEDLNDSDWR